MADAAPTPSLDKAPRDRLELAARPPAATRLNRTVIGGGLAVALVLGSLAVMMSLQTSTPTRAPTDAQALGAVTLPEGMRDGPHGYGYLKKPTVQVAQTGPPADPPPPVATPPPPPVGGQAAPPSTPSAPPKGPSPDEQARDAARKSGLFFPRAAPAPTGPAEAVPPAPLPPRGQEGTRLDDDPPAHRLPPIAPDQAEKRAFLRTAGSAMTALKGQLQSPRSPYEIKAGTIIPSVLLTGINSDLPGELLAQVREHVYDTVSGRYLLLPQGSKLVGTYDSAVIYGQDRVLVVWSRVILPNGDALSLENMPGVDLAGYAGFRDTVNHHWGRLLGAVVLSSVLNIGTRIPAGDVAAGRFFPTVGQEATQDVGQGLGRAGQQVVQRQLQIQPTITIRPGFAINVFVHRDMVLRPYQDARRVASPPGPQE